MALADARAICPDLTTRPADLAALRPSNGAPRSTARHPREQAKKLFPNRNFH